MPEISRSKMKTRGAFHASALLLLLCLLGRALGQGPTQMDHAGNLIPATMPYMYSYAFTFQLGMEQLGTKRDSDRGAGWTARYTLKAHFNLNAKQFALFEQAALQYGQAQQVAEDELRAVILADRAEHPGSSKRSPEAIAKTHALLAEIDQAAKDQVGNIHEALDPKVAHKLDQAVVKFYSESQQYHGGPAKPNPSEKAPPLATPEVYQRYPRKKPAPIRSISLIAYPSSVVGIAYRASVRRVGQR